MRERLRVLLATCFYYSGLIRLALWWSQRKEHRLIILNYHRAMGKQLRHQLSYLRRHYRIMHLEEALEELYTPGEKGAVRDRRTPLVLTFDDGYLDNYTQGWQLARELQVPITIFLLPGYSESGQYFWWLAADYLVPCTTVENVTTEGCMYDLRQVADRQALVQMIDTHARTAHSVAERERFLSMIQQALGVTLPCRTTACIQSQGNQPQGNHKGLPLQWYERAPQADPSSIVGAIPCGCPVGGEDTAFPLTWDEIREMEQSGWVSYGAHTMHHPTLSYLTDASELQREVVESRQCLEQKLGHPIRTFAYPIGKFEHIGEKGLQAVKDAGYQWGLSTIEAINTPDTDPYLLGRLPGDERLHWLVMAAELAGLLGLMSRVRRKR